MLRQNWYSWQLVSKAVCVFPGALSRHHRGWRIRRRALLTLDFGFFNFFCCRHPTAVCFSLPFRGNQVYDIYDLQDPHDPTWQSFSTECPVKRMKRMSSDEPWSNCFGLIFKHIYIYWLLAFLIHEIQHFHQECPSHYRTQSMIFQIQISFQNDSSGSPTLKSRLYQSLHSSSLHSSK